VGSLVADLRDRARSLEKQAADAAERLVAQEQALGIEQAAVQEARDALVQALDEKSSVESTLNQRIAELSEDLLQREQRLAEAASALAEQQQLAEELRARIGEGEQRAAVLKANIAEMASDLRKKDERIRRAEQALETTQHDKQAVESRLQDRFGELATITRMLAEAEERERQARAEADWLREAGSVLLSDANRRKGAGLLGLLPASLQAKRQRRLLKERGLFDEEAYLASNPDVAAEGADPLGHYVKHGIAEERRRG
jgi:chromosome segregation ATPase